MEARTKMKVVPITPEDINFINEEIKPKHKKGLIYFSLFFFAFSILAPFIPGRNVHVTSFNSSDYIYGFMFYGICASLIIGFLYFKSIYCLNRDLQEGEKLVLNVKVLRRAKNRYAQD